MKRADPPNLRVAQREATASAVLAAAREEFEAAGFEGANVRAIAARAKVSPGTVLHHYGDKRELLHAALFEDLEATLARALKRLGSGPLERELGRLGESVFAYYQRRPGLSRTLLRESLFAEGPWAQRFTGQVAQLHGRLAGLAAAAIARGELRPTVDPALLAAAWFSFFSFALLSWAQGAHPTPVTLLERLTAQHLEGLRPAPRRKGAKR
jgi:AcrR family transcriptional regulator